MLQFSKVTIFKSCKVAKLQKCKVAKLQKCKDAKLQSCTLAKLKCCNVVKLQCCNVAMLQCCNVAMLQCCNVCKVAMLQCCNRWQQHNLGYTNTRTKGQLKIQKKGLVPPKYEYGHSPHPKNEECFYHLPYWGCLNWRQIMTQEWYQILFISLCKKLQKTFINHWVRKLFAYISHYLLLSRLGSVKISHQQFFMAWW